MHKSFCEHVFISLGYIPRSRIVGSHGNCVFKFLRNCQTALQSGWNILYFQHQYTRVQISLHFLLTFIIMSFPGNTSGKEPTCQCRKHKRCRFNPWVGKIPWRRPWQPQSLGWEDPLEEAMATHSSILAWRIQWTEKSGPLRSIGLQRVRPDWNYLAPMQVIIIKYHLSLVTFLSHCMNTSSFIFSLATYLCLWN